MIKGRSGILFYFWCKLLRGIRRDVRKVSNSHVYRLTLFNTYRTPSNDKSQQVTFSPASCHGYVALHIIEIDRECWRNFVFTSRVIFLQHVKRKTRGYFSIGWKKWVFFSLFFFKYAWFFLGITKAKANPVYIHGIYKVRDESHHQFILRIPSGCNNNSIHPFYIISWVYIYNLLFVLIRSFQVSQDLYCT